MFETVSVIISLVILEGLLSVDNAMVIAAMVGHLPGRQKMLALRLGMLGAYGLRGAALAGASFLIAHRWIKLLGGAYLLYLMVSHLIKGDHGEEKTPGKQAGLVMTVVMVELADLAFSIDNVIAAVALSPKLWVVCVGCFAGIAVMRFVAGFFVKLMERKPILKPTAYILVGYVGGLIFLEELAHIHLGEIGKFAGIAIILGGALLLEKLRQPRRAQA